ncbi:MAG: hypothetical protein QM780_16020 [Hyphomicrobium sp.]|uniref:hypothetical protein n=1 Tax=Hyphomicrobium sp. TaxID=82 RepID=UPI0039E55F84
MSIARQIALIVLGAIVIAAAVILWNFATEIMTSIVEKTWCKTIDKSHDCSVRGYQHVLIWSFFGLINLLIMGFLIERARR